MREEGKMQAWMVGKRKMKMESLNIEMEDHKVKWRRS